jgi:flavin-dependent dehydrogenase
MPEHDVFVIGGGPAGLAAAIAAARRGMRVVVTDANAPPIDKPCGEGLMPDSRLHAERLGIDLPPSSGYEFRGIRFHGAGRSVESDFPRGRGIGIRRTVLHEKLVGAAVKAGVELRWNTTVSGLDKIRARWIVGADGSCSRVRRWAWLDSCHCNNRRYAYRQHFAVAPWTDCVEVHWGDGCQIYVTPVSREEVCIALISRAPELRLGEALRRFFPVLHDRLAGASATSRERGSVTATRRLRAVTRGNVALIGDASGSVDAITGEGICLSFRQAEVLAAAMAKGDLAGYNRTHPRLALRPQLMARTMLTLDRGASARRWALSAMSWQPWIFRKLLAVHVLETGL